MSRIPFRTDPFSAPERAVEFQVRARRILDAKEHTWKGEKENSLSKNSRDLALLGSNMRGLRTLSARIKRLRNLGCN